MKKQVLEEIEFSGSQLNGLAASSYGARDEIHLKIVEL